MLIAISLTIKFFQESNLPSSIYDQTTSVNLIVIFNLFTNKEEKLFYCYSRITNMNFVGQGDRVIIGADQELALEIFDINEGKFCHIFEKGINPVKEEIGSSNLINPKFKLRLPSYVISNCLNSKIINIERKIIDTSYKLILMDQDAYLSIYNLNESILLNRLVENVAPIREELKINLIKQIERVYITSENFLSQIKIINFSLSRTIKNSFVYIIYILTNLGFCKVNLKGKNEIVINVIHNNNIENNSISSFDLSDTGHIIIAYSDYTLKLIEEESFTKVFQTSVGGVSEGTFINNVYFSNIICKNEEKKLIRKSLIANFYVITSKNEFIIFDMNQKNKADIKVINFNIRKLKRS
jgi:hypothetical protein